MSLMEGAVFIYRIGHVDSAWEDCHVFLKHLYEGFGTQLLARPLKNDFIKTELSEL